MASLQVADPISRCILERVVALDSLVPALEAAFHVLTLTNEQSAPFLGLFAQ